MQAAWRVNAVARQNWLVETNMSDVIAVFSSTRLPGFTGRDLLTTTESSVTSHHLCHFLSCLLKRRYRRQLVANDARLPQPLCWLPVDNHILKHVLPFSTYRA